MDHTPLSLMSSSLPPAPAAWMRFPYTDVPLYDAQSMVPLWPRLHASHLLPLPEAGALREGWAHYHSGAFDRAAAIGLQHGGAAGMALANQATAVYANYLEPREANRQALFRQVAERAAAQAAAAPDDWVALYWQAYALGHYCHSINVARALAQGLGSRVKGALERVIALQPEHADAHVALASFHADVINKVGPLVGRMTYGVQADEAMRLYQRGLELDPHSISALIEYAHGLVMLHGEACMHEANLVYERAAALPPLDARQRLDAELARAGLLD